MTTPPVVGTPAVLTTINAQTETITTTLTFYNPPNPASITLTYRQATAVAADKAVTETVPNVSAEFAARFPGSFSVIASVSATSTTNRSSSSSLSTSTSKAPPRETRAPNTSTSSPRNASPQSTTSIPSTSTSRPSASGSSSLSTGATVGVVIGAAVGLAILTFLLTFFCMRRRQHSKQTSRNKTERYELDGKAYTGAQNGTAELQGSAFKLGTVGMNVSTARSIQSADDNTIRAKARTLMDQAELFVENFYLDSADSRHPPSHNALSAFDSPYLPKELGALLIQSHQCSDLIKHVLAYSIFKRITTGSDIEDTFLPPEYALAPPNPETRAEDPELTRSLAQWRTLTIFLRPDASLKPSFIFQRNERIERLSDQFLNAFNIWAQPKYSEKERKTSLESILKEAAEFGVFLFSQPSQIQFRWPSRSQLGSKRIAVLPALDKLTDEKGNILASPQVLVEPNIKGI